MCKRKCNDSIKKVHTRKIYAAKSKITEERCKSSSGGFFYHLAESVIENNGIVFGVAFNKIFEAEHILVEQKEDLNVLRKSKYSQSNVGKSFINVKNMYSMFYKCSSLNELNLTNFDFTKVKKVMELED